jgi:hypothetical protein
MPRPAAPVASILLLAVVPVLALPGCGGGAETTDAAPAAPAVDPRFASADALLDHYNSIAMKGPVIDLAAILDLMHAENDLQRRMLGAMRSMMPMYEIEVAMRERFGEGLNPGEMDASLAPSADAAVIGTRSDRRAEATYTDHDGSTSTLYLVQIGPRWWLSGFTLEHDPDFVSDPDELEKMETMASKLAPVLPPVLARVRAGEFSAAQEVRMAIAMALIEANRPSDAAPPAQPRSRPGLSGG